jgi:hypothetical protein
VTTYLVAAPATPVAVIVTGEPVRPGPVAVRLLAPAVVPKVQPPTVAMPVALVIADAPVIEPLPEATAKVTVTPGTALLCESLTRTLGAVATALPAVAVCALPAYRAIWVGAPGLVLMAALVPVLVPPLVLRAVIVYVLPLVLLVVNVDVATPLAFVFTRVALKRPPVPVLAQVTRIPEVATGLPYWSASWAVIVTAVPATGP